MIIANSASDLYGALVVVGIMAHLSIQVILNIAVVTNTIPNLGISLPFIGYGGTSVLFLLAEMGLALSVARELNLRLIKYDKRREKKKKAQKDRIVHPVDIDSAYRDGRFHCHECFYRGKRCRGGNELYSSTQIENMVLNDEYSWNSLYVDLKYRFVDIREVPFVDTMEVSLDNPIPYILKFTKKECSAIFILIPLVRMLILTKMDL